jgi:hypothetical protein
MDIWNNVKAGFGDNHAKGDLFEGYVARLFPESFFTIVHHTPSRNDLNGRFIESKQMPDFQIRHNASGHRFWVECKWRGQLKDGKIDWSNPEQLERYRDFQRDVRPEMVYVVIGYGGWPSIPDSIYCIPLNEVKYPGLYPQAIQNYLRPKNIDFWYQEGRLR